MSRSRIGGPGGWAGTKEAGPQGLVDAQARRGVPFVPEHCGRPPSGCEAAVWTVSAVRLARASRDLSPHGCGSRRVPARIRCFPTNTHCPLPSRQFPPFPGPQRAPPPPWPRPGPPSPPLRAEALPRPLPRGRRALPGSDGCDGSGGEGGRPRGPRAPRKPPEGPVDEGASRRVAHPPCVFLRTPSFSCYFVRAFFQ